MSLHVLSVAYPLAPVGPDAVGGAEQVLATLERGLLARGHRSTVIACAGSRPAGELVPVAVPRGALDEARRDRASAAVRAAVEAVCRRDPPDLIHFHGLDVLQSLPPPGVPAVVTLHLPPSWYPPEVFTLERPDTILVCVSASQRAACPPARLPLEIVENGVPVDQFAGHHARRGFVLNLGRICPEKGQHTAIAAARRAGVPLLIGGAAFDYPEHRAYFAHAVAPHLGPACRFLGPLGFARKRRLLSAAKALLLPTTAPETSSLVTMEAFACATPVIALRSGALPELIEDGRTGFLVDDEAGMAARISAVDTIDGAACRRVARARFDASRMVEDYLALYSRLLPDRTAGHGRSGRPVSAATRILTDPAELAALEPDWRRLWEEASEATPFQHPGWLTAWWEALPKGELFTVAAEADGRLTGLLPLCRVAVGGRAVLRPLAFDVSDYGEPLIGPGEPSATRAALFDCLAAAPGWECCALTLRDGATLPPASGLRVAQHPLEPAPVLDLTAGFPDYLLAGIRKSLAEARRRLSRMGEARFETATAAGAADALGHLFALHARRWRERGEPGVLDHPAVQAFHRAAARRLAEAGLLRLTLMRIGGCPAAVHYGFTAKRTGFYYLGGFDPRFRAASPGSLVVAHAIEAAVREGCQAFDFLKGREAYKYRWGAKDRGRRSIEFRRDR